MRFNEDNRILVESLETYKVYYNNKIDETRYELLHRGTPVPGMSNLKHGVDLWHFKDPHYEHMPLPAARINFAYSYLTMEMHGIKANANLFSKGMIGLTLLSLDPKANSDMSVPDDKGETKLQKWLKETVSQNDLSSSGQISSRLTYN